MENRKNKISFKSNFRQIMKDSSKLNKWLFIISNWIYAKENYFN